ncbi:Alpha-(1,3)-fucosyltransferase 5 [Exaiptasia diaphana]|nr:Alpha-(1,3)-fucosyltransferase 5 [Exaiptasia diaphana]
MTSTSCYIRTRRYERAMAWLHIVSQSLLFRLLAAVVATNLIIWTYKNRIPRDFAHPSLPFVQPKNVTVTTEKPNNISKRILFYTSWFGKIPWPLNGPLKLPCPHKCSITYNKNELAFSNAVVFHDSDIDDPRSLKRISESLRRRAQQRWVYYTHENPHNVHNPAPFNGIFNWTVTYRSDSDIPRPYGHYNTLQHGERILNENNTINYAKGKDKLIAWAVSHCGTIRDKVAKKLHEFVPVTVIGKCSNLFNQDRNGIDISLSISS